jgi:hypothetical protein
MNNLSERLQNEGFFKFSLYFLFFMVIVLVENAAEPRQNFPFRNLTSFESNGSPYHVACRTKQRFMQRKYMH